MTSQEASAIARAVCGALSPVRLLRLKSIRVDPKLTEGIINVRICSFPISPEEPEGFAFTKEELM